MTATPDAYLAQLQALLPPGAAWPRDPDLTLTEFLAALAEEFARVDCRADELVDEADPRTTLELLVDWERVTGLPDECTDLATTLQERRAALVAKLTSSGGQSRQFYIDAAASLGFTVTITEFRPFQVGRSTAGEPLYGTDWWFAWQINGPETTIREFRTGESTAGEPLRNWGNEFLECALERLRPGHTELLFSYGG